MAYAQNEYLSELFGNIDDSILDEAFSVDSPAALRKLKARERWERAKRFAISENVRRAGALVACMALVVSMILSIPAALRYIKHMVDVGNGIMVNIPVFELIPEGEAIVIDSLDKLNYYSGLRALDGELGLKSAKGTYSFSTRSLSLAPSGAFFSPNDEFEITMASFFCLTLDENDGYLYDRFGEGKIYVVATKNNFADMITFRKGNDFYTCLASEEQDGRMVFTSERYAVGFGIAEQTEGERFAALVNLGGEYPQSLTLRGLDGEAEYNIELLRGSYAFSDDVTILTVNELEKYYANKFSENTDGVTDKITDMLTDQPTEELTENSTEKNAELSAYAGTYGNEEDYRGTLSFPDLSREGEEHIALWKSQTLGEYKLIIRKDGSALIFASEDGAIGGSIELYNERIYLNVEHSVAPEMLLGSYMFEVE
jgi:hypothetical protein